MSFSYAVFTNENRHWLSRFLDKDYNHCFIIEPIVYGYRVINSTYSNIEIYTLDDIGDIIANSKMIKVKRKDRPKRIFMLDTCVGLTKQYLGISNPFILTPKQLMHHLGKYNV